MRPMDENHAWNAASERRLNELVDKLTVCNRSLFDIWMALVKLRESDAPDQRVAF
jgi:hypothetical protein